MPIRSLICDLKEFILTYFVGRKRFFWEMVIVLIARFSNDIFGSVKTLTGQTDCKSNKLIQQKQNEKDEPNAK